MAYAPFVSTYTPEPTRPSGGETPGARALMDWTLASWDDADVIDNVDPTTLGIYAARDICGNWWPDVHCTLSQHARGAALDVGFPVVAGGHPEGHKYANWLVANAAILGVQEVIWADRRWDNQTKRWAAYNGRSPHLDHVHVALNASGATYLTLARIQSVAPEPVQEDPLAALTEDEQQELLAKVRTLEARKAASVVRRAGTSGMNTVSLAFGLFRAPIPTQALADLYKYLCGQKTALSLRADWYDHLEDVEDIDALADLITASG